MRKKVTGFDTGVPLSAYGDGKTVYVTTDEKKYAVGVNLSLEQVERKFGGIEQGGETFLHVK